MWMKRVGAAVLVGSALLLAACSSSDSSDGSGGSSNTVDQGVKDAVASQIGGGETDHRRHRHDGELGGGPSGGPVQRPLGHVWGRVARRPMIRCQRPAGRPR